MPRLFYIHSSTLALACILLFISIKTNATKIFIPEVDTIGFTDYYQFTNDGNYPSFALGDSAKFQLQIPNWGKNLALYIGNAEVIALKYENTIVYSGIYAPKERFGDKKALNCVKIPDQFLGRIIEIICYNRIGKTFFVAPHILTEKQMHLNRDHTYRKGQRGNILLIAYLGGIFFFTLFCFASHYQNKKNTEYLFLGIHLLGMIAFTFIQADAYFHTYILFPNNPIIYHQIYDSSLMLSYIGFLLLMKDFLDLKKTAPKINKLTNNIIMYMLTAAFIFFFFAVNDIYPNYAKWLTTLYVLAFALAFFQNRLILKSKNIPYRKYSIIGNIILVCFLFVEFSFVRFGPESDYFWAIEKPFFQEFYLFNISQLGNFVFIIFYAMSIGYKQRDIERNLAEFQSKEIDRLEDKEEIKKETLRLMRKKEAMQRSQLERSDYLFKQSKTQIGLLKNSINPKFIQNNIDAINQNIEEGFIKYHRWHISKFSKLLQNSIEFSHVPLVPLAIELENMKLYIELEELRINKSLKSAIILQPTLIKSNILVPPFLLQEFIEFCLWNIIYDKKSKSSLSQRYEIKEEVLKIHIEIKGKLDHIVLNSYDLNDILDRINTKINYAYNQNEESYHLEYDRTLNLMRLTIHLPLEVTNYRTPMDE